MRMDNRLRFERPILPAPFRECVQLAPGVSDVTHKLLAHLLDQRRFQFSPRSMLAGPGDEDVGEIAEIAEIADIAVK